MVKALHLGFGDSPPRHTLTYIHTPWQTRSSIGAAILCGSANKKINFAVHTLNFCQVAVYYAVVQVYCSVTTRKNSHDLIIAYGLVAWVRLDSNVSAVPSTGTFLYIMPIWISVLWQCCLGNRTGIWLKSCFDNLLSFSFEGLWETRPWSNFQKNSPIKQEWTSLVFIFIDWVVVVMPPPP